MIDSWDCCYHFPLVEAVRRNLSRGHDPVLSVLVSRETGVSLQSPSSSCTSTPSRTVHDQTFDRPQYGRGWKSGGRCRGVEWQVAVSERPLMSTNVFQVATCNLQNAYCISCPLHWLRWLCRRSLFCPAAVQVFSLVSLVFALHMIKIWNYENGNRTVNRGSY